MRNGSAGVLNSWFNANRKLLDCRSLNTTLGASLQKRMFSKAGQTAHVGVAKVAGHAPASNRPSSTTPRNYLMPRASTLICPFAESTHAESLARYVMLTPLRTFIRRVRRSSVPHSEVAGSAADATNGTSS